MKKKNLEQNVNKTFNETKDALQTIWNNVVKGQKKQIRKIDECVELLDRYGITDESA